MMYRALLSAGLALAIPTMAAAQSSQAVSPAPTEQAGQLNEFWSSVFPMPGESYGMFPDPYGSPHDSQTILQAHEGRDIASPPDNQQTATTGHQVDPGLEGPDLRDASGRTD